VFRPAVHGLRRISPELFQPRLRQLESGFVRCANLAALRQSHMPDARFATDPKALSYGYTPPSGPWEVIGEGRVTVLSGIYPTSR
jgi:hypothetical protein